MAIAMATINQDETPKRYTKTTHEDEERWRQKEDKMTRNDGGRERTRNERAGTGWDDGVQSRMANIYNALLFSFYYIFVFKRFLILPPNFSGIKP
jgi:hypothetical protein